MPNQIHLENSRRSRCALRRAKLILFASFFILFFTVAKGAVVAPVITSATTVNGTVGSAFSYQITATNAPSSYGATGLPAGLTVNSGTGLISGTPTAKGKSTVTLSATNSGGTGNATLTLTVIPTFVQAVANTANGTINSMSLSFSKTTVTGDLIVVGFDFNANATASSVTDSQGNTFTPVGTQLTSPGGNRSRVYYAKNIKGGADTVTVNLSANSTFMEAYLTEYSGVDQTNPIDAQAGASGNGGSVSSGNATTTFAGDVIYGYCLADSTCTVGSGFAARSTFDSNLIEDATAGNAGTYAATGSANSGWTMQMVALKLASYVAVVAPVITSAATANGTVGRAFSYQITATNAPSSYGATGLPAGLTVNSGTGLISGTPTAAGTSTVTLSATNGSGTGNATLTLTIAAAAPVITSATTANGTVGSAFSYQITATNAPSSYGATGLPAGLTVNSGTGLISGTPTAAGTSTVTLSATNSSGTGNATLTLSIFPTSSFVQAVANTANGTINSMSLSFSKATVTGDLIVVGFDFNANATASSVTDSQGNTFTPVGTQLTSPGGNRSRVFYAKNIKGGADTVTVNLSANSTFMEAYLAEYSGVDQTNPIDAQAGASGYGGSVSSGNATTTFAGDVIYGYCLADSTCTAGSGFAARSTFDSNLIEDATAGNAGTYAATGSASSGWTMQMVALKLASSGTVTAAVASLSPTSLTFASQAVGATSAAQTVTLNNTGNATLTLASIALSGTNASDFAQTNNCGSSVAVGANCTISVTFAPTASGSRTGAVTLTDNATGSPQTVSLSGAGTAAVASLSPTSLTFASQAVGATSAPQTVTLNNTGNAALTLTSIALSGTSASDFAQTNNCGSSVTAGANCTINVTFTPAASGTRTAAVTLTDNATGSPQTVSLSGTGGSAGAVANISPSSLTFGNQPVDTVSSSQAVTLNNSGSAALSITSIAFTGADPADFTENNTCNSSVAAGGTCTIAISFTPSATGTREASLSITDNASGSPQSVSNSGTGTHDIILAWAASPPPGVSGYNLYRGTTPGGESATPINSAPINGTSYVDGNVTAGVTYYYVAMAVASDGVTLSTGSNEASAKVPSP